MKSTDIVKLPLNTPLVIQNFRYQAKRGGGIADVTRQYTVKAVLVSHKRYRNWGWGNWNTDLTALTGGLVETKTGERDFGYLVRIDEPQKVSNAFTAPIYGIVDGKYLLGLESEYDAYWAQREIDDAKERVEHEARMKARQEIEARRQEARNKTLVQANARKDALILSLSTSMKALVGERKMYDTIYGVEPRGEYRGTDEKPEYVITGWGEIRMPVEIAQTLIELALIGKDA